MKNNKASKLERIYSGSKIVYKYNKNLGNFYNEKSTESILKKK